MSDGSLRVGRTEQQGNDVLRVDLSSPGDVVVNAGASADVVLAIDTTGSMGDKIEGLLATCQRFVDLLASKRIDWRLSVMAFGDLLVDGDKIVATSFSGDVEVVKKAIRSVPRYSGGSNDGESSLDALARACELSGYRRHAMRAVILITDEPAHLTNELNPATIARRLRASSTLAFVVSPSLPYFREIATGSGGRWFEVSATADFTAVLELFNDLAGTVAAVIDDVRKLGGGDVAAYRRLRP